MIRLGDYALVVLLALPRANVDMSSVKSATGYSLPSHGACRYGELGVVSGRFTPFRRLYPRHRMESEGALT